MSRNPKPRKASTTERRRNGTRIKSGLEELVDLDAAPPPKRVRAETEPAIPATSTTPTRPNRATSPAKVLSSPIPPKAWKANATHPTPAEHDDGEALTATSVFGPDWSEWRAVKQSLFRPFGRPEASDARRWALDRVQQLWHARARKHRPLPSYAESTAVLMEAFVLDENGSLSSCGALMYYGAAISRVVHLMTGTFAVGDADTYRKRARMIGFPEEAVEVRQRVAHGTPPLLSELRWVAGLVLQFLFRCYWMEQERQTRIMEEAEKEAKGAASDDGNGEGESASEHHVTEEEMRELLKELSEASEDSTQSDSDYALHNDNTTTTTKDSHARSKGEDVIHPVRSRLGVRKTRRSEPLDEDDVTGEIVCGWKLCA